MAQMKKFLALFGVLLISVALIALCVGGIGIHNMMLVSLSEQYKEIGLRKAIGATDRAVRFQFLSESTLLCCLAGIFGIVLGFTVYQSIIWITARFVPKLTFEWVINPTALSLSLFSILAVGIASGILPALKAERLQVIEALRAE